MQQTYANLISSKSFSPHLESVDFLRFLRVSVVIALILGVAFSIRGNFLGLKQALEKDIFWLLIIGLSLTSTSSILAMLTVVKINGLKIVSRVLIGVISLSLFYISGRLTYLGFTGSEKQSVVNAIQENPELSQAKEDLQNIINRQNEYGLTQSEKISLMAREKEQRVFTREIEKRLIIENRNKKSAVETSLGEERKLALMMFSFAPELCIAVLSPLVVLLFSMGLGVESRQAEQSEAREPETRVVYVPVQMPGNGGGVEKIETPGVPSQAELASMVQNNQGNGKAVWNPFQ